MHDVIGLKENRIKKERVAFQQLGIFVLSELMLLTSRVANTVRLQNYRNAYAKGQLKQAIAVVKAAIVHRLKVGDVSSATKLAHGLLDLANHDIGIHAFVYHNVDVLEAWVESEGYRAEFLAKAKPVLFAEISRKRKSLLSRKRKPAN